MLENLNYENFKDGRYKSIGYLMTQKTDTQKELRKAKYIENPKERLKRIRELLPQESEGVSIERAEIPPFKELGFNDFKEYERYVKKIGGMFYDCWVEFAYKRELEIFCYLQDIKTKLHEYKNDFEKTCYLIEQQHTEHTGIFDNKKEDYVFRDEYRAIIWDVLQYEIDLINNKKDVSIREQTETEIQTAIKTAIKKPLQWNADKNTIGTLFGLLHEKKIIQGTKTDIVKVLATAFNNLSEKTLTDNVSLKINTAENKTKYDTDTVEKLSDWVNHLKTQLPKSTPK